MTKREKIIVGVMCLTIVYGAYELLGSRKSAPKQATQEANPVGELKNFVLEVTQGLVGDDATKDYQYMIDQADAEWSKDPFLRSSALLKKTFDEPVEQVVQPITVESTPDIAYTGFMQMGKTKLAILNGIEYAAGDSLGNEEYIVKEIHPNRVVIGKTNSPETMQLPIAEIDSGIVK